MFKLIGGVIVGVFIGAMMLEIIQKKKPGLVKSVESKARDFSDKLFGNLQESYDLQDDEA